MNCFACTTRATHTGLLTFATGDRSRYACPAHEGDLEYAVPLAPESDDLARKREAWSALLSSVAASLGDSLARCLPADYTQSLVETLRGQVGCFDCGAREPIVALDGDHRDASTKYRTARGRVVHLADMWKPSGDGRTRYAAIVILAELAKCDVVCASCHRARTWPEPKPRAYALPVGADRASLVAAYLAAGGGETRV